MPSDPLEQPTMTVEQVAAVLCISRNSAYDAIRSGDLPSARVGKRIIVPTAAIRRLLALDPPLVG